MDTTFRALKGQVDTLIKLTDTLRQENHILRQSLTQVRVGKDKLQTKHHQVQARVEQLLVKLKNIQEAP